MFYENAYMRKHKKGWRGVLKYRDDAGSWRQCSKTLEATGKAGARRELEQWRQDMEHAHELEEAAQAAAMEAGTPTLTTGDVPEFVGRFIDRLDAAGAIEPSTVRDYRLTLTRIKRGLEGIEAAELTAAQAAEYEAAELARGMSPVTVGKTHRLLKQAYREAVALEMLPRNPFDAVRPPKRPRPRHNSLDLDGRTRLLAFLDMVEPTPEVLAGRIAIYTGMRRGEVCALRWTDVDLARASIRVTQAIGVGTGETSTYTKATKTDQPRTAPIPRDLLPYLQAEKRAQATAWLESGQSFDVSRAYVLTGTDMPACPGTLTRKWGDLARLSGIRGAEGRPPTFHDLRHTYATVAIAAGVDVKAVQSVLGHASAAMTLDVYACADADAVARAGEIVNGAMLRPPASVIQLEAV